MSETTPDQHPQPHLPAKPETRRGVVTNPLVVSNARGDRPNTTQNGDRSKNGNKSQPSDGPSRKKKGNRNQNQNANQNAQQNGQNQNQPTSKGKRKNTNASSNDNSHHTTSANDSQDLNKILYPDMFDESGNRKAAPAPVPVTPKADAYSGSSFHSAPAASSLPRPSFAASPVSAGIPGISVGPSASPGDRMPVGPPPVWNGPAPTGGQLHNDMPVPMQGMPMPMQPPPPHMPMMPQPFSYGYYPPYGYNMPINSNGYYYPPPWSVGAVDAPNQ